LQVAKLCRLTINYWAEKAAAERRQIAVYLCDRNLCSLKKCKKCRCGNSQYDNCRKLQDLWSKTFPWVTKAPGGTDNAHCHYVPCSEWCIF